MSEAERLADLLERDPSEWGGLSLGWKAAAELRRLSAELEKVCKDAERWQMVPAFIEDHQIDYVRLKKDIDAAMKGTP